MEITALKRVSGMQLPLAGICMDNRKDLNAPNDEMRERMCYVKYNRRVEQYACQGSRVTQDSESRDTDINYALYAVHVCWDTRDRHLHVYLIIKGFLTTLFEIK